MFVCESISNHRCNPPCDQQICSSSPDSVRKPCLAVGKRHEYPHRGTNNVNLAKPLSLSPINRRSEAVCRTISISTVHFSYAYIGVPSAYILGFSSVLFLFFCFLFRSFSDPSINGPLAYPPCLLFRWKNDPLASVPSDNIHTHPARSRAAKHGVPLPLVFFV